MTDGTGTTGWTFDNARRGASIIAGRLYQWYQSAPLLLGAVTAILCARITIVALRGCADHRLL